MIVDCSKVMVAHGIDPQKWAQRYGIEPFTADCCQCGRSSTTSIPFAQGTLRGLMAPACECGHPTPPYCVVRDPKAGDLFTGAA